MEERENRVSAWWVLPVSMIAWWTCGFLPWILQASYQVIGLGAGPSGSPDGFLPIPFTDPDATVGLIVMALVGGVLAGATSGLASSRGGGAAAAIAGSVVSMGTAIALSWNLATQAADVVGAGSAGDVAGAGGVPVSPLVVTGVAGLVGLACGVLAGVGPAALRGIALALPVVLLDGWLWGLVPGHAVAPEGTWWVFAVVLGLAFGLVVDSRPIELLGWLPAAGVVWVLQATGPALMAAQGDGLSFATQPAAAAGFVWDAIASAAIVTDGHQLGAWVVALLLGAAVAALRLSREAERKDGRGVEPEEQRELAEVWV